MQVAVEGRIASTKERRPELMAEAEARIRKANQVITKLEKKAPNSNKLHQKQRRLATLQDRLASLKTDEQTGTIRLCFGGKKRFNAQFNLEANGHANHQQF